MTLNALSMPRLRLFRTLLPPVLALLPLLLAAQGRTLYWTGAQGMWDDAANWSLTSGGPGGAGVPRNSDAVVVEQSPTALTAPKVRAFYSLRSRMPITPVLIDLAGPGCADRIVAKEPSGEWSPDLVNGLWLPPELAQGTR